MTSKWKKLSENGAKNRKSAPGDDGDCLYVRYTGGSINFNIHNQRLEKLLGHKPTQLESFATVHKKQKGKGEWCDARAEKSIQKYDAKRKEKHPCEKEHPCEEDKQLELPFDPDAWLEATTLSKNKQPYGVVDLQKGKKIVSKVASSSSSRMQSHPETLISTKIERQIEKEVACRVDSIRVEMEGKMKAEMKANEERMLAEMEKMKQMFMASQNP